MKKNIFFTNVLTISAFSLISAEAQSLQLLQNGGFQTTTNDVGTYLPTNNANFGFVPQSDVSGWNTTSSAGTIEIWKTGFLGVNAANGTDNVSGYFNGSTQFAEINAETAGALYQDVTFAQSGAVDFFFLHRGRTGADTLRLSILNLGINGSFNSTFNNGTGLGNYTLGGDDSVAFTQTFTSDNVNSAGEYNGFVAYAGDDVFQAVAGETYRFTYGSVSSSNGDSTYGNFIDNAAFGINLQNDWTGGNVTLVPEPTTFGLLGLSCGLSLLVRRRR